MSDESLGSFATLKVAANCENNGRVNCKTYYIYYSRPYYFLGLRNTLLTERLHIARTLK